MSKTSIGAKTILPPHPVFVVGTYDKTEKANIAAVAWGGICCSNPPAIAVSLREATQSYKNIVLNQAFTVNIPSVDQIRIADYVGMVSGKDVDKFDAAGITAVKSDLVHAPYVEEFPFHAECKLIKTVVIGLHTQFIGEIKDVKVRTDLLDENGHLDVNRVRPAVFATGNRAYYALGEHLLKAFSVKEM